MSNQPSSANPIRPLGRRFIEQVRSARLLRTPVLALFVAMVVIVGLELAGISTRLQLRGEAGGDVKREMMWLAQYGQFTCVAVLALGVLLLDARRWHGAAMVVGAVLMASLASTILKFTAGRARPTALYSGEFLGPLAPHKSAYWSFPSGHTTAAFALSTVLATLYPRGRGLFWSLAIGCGALRWVQDAHWLGDVLAGATLGIVIGRFVQVLIPAAVPAQLPTLDIDAPSRSGVAASLLAFSSRTAREQARGYRTDSALSQVDAQVPGQASAPDPLPLPAASPAAGRRERAGRSRFERARRRISAVAVLAFVVALAFRHPPIETPGIEAVEHAGFALLIVAAFGRVWAAFYLNGRKSKVLCRCGPYSLTRNPLYLFSLIGAIGFGMALESVVLPLAIGVAFIVYYHFVINHEERRLAAAFGGDFEAYRHEVPRLLPRRLRGYREASSLVVSPGVFFRSLTDASVFAFAIVFVEFWEAASRSHVLAALPRLWSIS